MTIAFSTRRSGPYTAAGGETVFNYGWLVYAASELGVYRTRAGADAQLVLTADYTVQGVGSPAGGTVTLTAAAQAGDVYVVHGARPLARAASFPGFRSIPANAVDVELNSLEMQLQEVRRDLGRAIAVRPADADGTFLLPLKAARASKFLGFDVDGLPTALASTGTEWLVIAGSGAPSASLGDDGDLAINGTGVVYKKVSGAWVLTGVTITGSFDINVLVAEAGLDPAADTIGFYDASVPGNRKALVGDLVNPNLFAAETAIAVDDAVLVHDASANARRKVRLDNLVNPNAFTAETEPAVADELVFHDASAPARRKITFENLLKVVAQLTAETAVDPAADHVLLHDASAAAARRVTPASLVNPNVFPAETAVAADDEVLVHDASAGARRKVRLDNLLNPNALVAETEPAVADELVFHDASAPARRKITFENLLKVVAQLTAETAVDPAADHVLLHDASAAAARRVTPASLVNPNVFTQLTGIAADDEVLVHDASAGARRKVAVSDLVNPDAFVNENDLALADTLIFHDASATARRKATLENLLKAINLFTEEAGVDPANDFFPFFDVSAGALRKAKPNNFGIAGGGGGASFPAEPQGRLTLTSNTPFLSADVSGATTVYYTPHTGRFVPLYNGTAWTMTDVGAELSQATTDTTKSPAAVAANSNYDLFVWTDGGTLRCTRGPAWSSATARGTGAGTSELERAQGRWTNKIAITNGPAAQRGTYVGTVRSNASSQIDFTFGGAGAGGVAASFHVWNAFHRKPVSGLVRNNTNTSAYTTAAWRQAFNSATFRANFVAGLVEDSFEALYQCSLETDGTSTIGIGYDVTNALSGINAVGHSNGNVAPLTAVFGTTPAIGSHFVSAIEFGGPSAVFFGDNNLAQHISGLSFRWHA